MSKEESLVERKKLKVIESMPDRISKRFMALNSFADERR